MNPSKHNRLRTFGYGLIVILIGVAVVLIALHFTQSSAPQHPGISQSAPQKQNNSADAGNSVAQTMGNNSPSSPSASSITSPSATPTAAAPATTNNSAASSTALTNTGPSNVVTVFVVSSVTASFFAYRRQILRLQRSR